MIVWVVWSDNKNSNEQFHAKEFDNAVRANIEDIEKHMSRYRDILRAGVGLFHASEEVTPQEWKNFVQGFDLKKNYPGMQGYGYAEMLKEEEILQTEQKMKSEGYEEFHLKPSGKREFYSAIVFLQPLDKRNIQALGYDMFSEPTRRKAMEIARDLADVAMSGKVTLVQEIDEDVQAGMLVYLPLYRKKAKLDTIADRQKALQGYVYAPFRMNDLMSKILPDDSILNYEIYDADSHTEQSLMYRSLRTGDYHSKYVAHKTLNIFNRQWHINFYSTQKFDESTRQQFPLILTLSSLAVYFILLLIITGLIKSRHLLSLQANELSLTHKKLSLQTASLQESEFRWKFAVEGNGDGLWDWNIPKDTVFFSPQWKKMIGYDIDEISSNFQEWEKRIHPDDKARVFKAIQDYLKGAIPSYSIEHRMLCKDGTYKWILTRGIIVDRTDAGDPVRLVGTHTDITASKEQSEALKKAQEKFYTLFEDSLDGIALVDPVSQRFVEFNHVAHEMLGYTKEEYGQLKTTDVEALDNEKQIITRQKAIIEKGWDQFITKHKTKDGAFKDVIVSIRAMDLDGQLMLHASFHDITKEKLLEKELIDAKDAAEKANRAKSDFLANMSHEIRTPLNGVIGLTELILKTKLDEKQKDYLEKVHLSSTTLLYIINDILDYSKIEAGKLNLEKKCFELSEVMQNLKNLFAYQANQKSLDFSLSYPDNITLIGDALRLMQILTNLTGNAIKFSKKGEIKISVKPLFEDENYHKLQFSVKDSGIGISEEVQKNLFKEFSQADNSITRKYGGTGLGLAISKQLVSMMGGRIWVESIPGSGSEFLFTATFEKPDHITVNDTQEDTNNLDEKSLCVLQGIRLLVVEDNKVNQIVVEGLLEDYGVDISMANNGKEAVEMTQKQTFDLILMDLQMPIMDGFEASKIIRKRDAHIPIIALSAAVMQADKQQTQEAGMNDHIAKPIDKNILLETLLKWLSTKA